MDRNGWPTCVGISGRLRAEYAAGGDVVISEVDDRGVVECLRIENKGDVAVLILCGQVLLGGRQNRILQDSILIPAHQTVHAGAHCIQKGRWAGAGNFSSGESVFRATSRASVISARTAHPERANSVVQQTVWSEVEKSLRENRVHSKSADFQELRRDENVSHRVQQIVDSIHPVPNEMGAIFYDHAGVIGVEVLHPSIFARNFEKLVRSYAFDALNAPPLNGANIESIKHWWNDALEIKFSKTRSTGVGDDLRLEGTNIVCSGLLYNGEILHLSVFPIAGLQSPLASARRRNMLLH